MFTVEKSVIINKPVAEVFAYANDPSKTTEWQGGVESVEYPAGGNALGAQYVGVRKFLGQEMKTTMEITALKPNELFAAKTLSGPVSFKVTAKFEGANGGTKMTTTVKGDPGSFFKLAEGMVVKNLEKSLEEDHKRLKSILEGA